MITNTSLLRPKEIRMNIPEGFHRGNIEAAMTKIVESQFTDTGKREVLEIKVSITLPNGETATLNHQVTLTWNPKGHMLPLLQKLDALPAPGEELNLDNLIGLPVNVVVENVKKGDRIFSNIVSMKRVEAEHAETKTIDTGRVDDILRIDDILED